MSDFFKPPPPPPKPSEHRQPEWFGPPDNVLGAMVPLELTLARTGDVALVIQAAEVFANGVQLTTRLLVREEVRHPMWHPFMVEDPLSPDILRLGAEYADGSKATNLDRPFFGGDPGERPPGPVFMPRGGGGGGRRWDVSFWLWPLPAADPFAVVVEWPARGIELTRVEVAVGPLLDAAARAEELWPNGEISGDGGFTVVRLVGKTRKEPPHADS